jgi:uncharacterized protein YegP (UPF0339 family)
VICDGQGYKSKDACMKGIESIKKNGCSGHRNRQLRFPSSSRCR